MNEDIRRGKEAEMVNFYLALGIEKFTINPKHYQFPSKMRNLKIQ